MLRGFFYYKTICFQFITKTGFRLCSSFHQNDLRVEESLYVLAFLRNALCWRLSSHH